MALNEMSAASYENGPQPAAATVAHLDPSTASLLSPADLKKASQAQRMREAKANLRSATERDYVQTVDRWLDGGTWEGADRYFTTGRGLTVRLMEDGDALTQDGVPIVSRNPVRLLDLPPGTRTSARWEARALAAVAVRGDAGWYDRKTRKVRDGVRLVWDGLNHVQVD
jgi:hypothetical protein